MSKHRHEYMGQALVHDHEDIGPHGYYGHPEDPPTVPTFCRHCGARLYPTGRTGRYAWTDNAAGTDTLGSGSECPKNERGHEVTP